MLCGPWSELTAQASWLVRFVHAPPPPPPPRIWTLWAWGELKLLLENDRGPSGSDWMGQWGLLGRNTAVTTGQQRALCCCRSEVCSGLSPRKASTGVKGILIWCGQPRAQRSEERELLSLLSFPYPSPPPTLILTHTQLKWLCAGQTWIEKSLQRRWPLGLLAQKRRMWFDEERCSRNLSGWKEARELNKSWRCYRIKWLPFKGEELYSHVSRGLSYRVKTPVLEARLLFSKQRACKRFVLWVPGWRLLLVRLMEGRLKFPSFYPWPGAQLLLAEGGDWRDYYQIWV